MSYDSNLPPVLMLSRTFSTYGCANSMTVEQWLRSGQNQPSDEAICVGFPILYNQVYHVDIYGKLHYSDNWNFTEEQKQRWKIMESITGLKPIMN